jgi:superfamily II DNA/RNA helicase
MHKDRRGHKQHGRREKKRKQDSDDEDEQQVSKKKQKRLNLDELTMSSQSQLPAFPKQQEMALKGYNRVFWTGLSSSTVDLDTLKLMRKSIGVLVKGDEVDSCPPPIKTMADDGIPKEFRDVFELLGIENPTTVQRQTWPAILNGNNVVSIAPTGSGKTLAYSLPMIPHIQSRLKAGKCKIFDKPAPFALVLVPTRELAVQVCQTLRPMKRLFRISSFPVYGGEDKAKQIDDLSEGHYIIVATPGRLLDLLHSREISLANVTYFVIDEADRMLALGFREQITSISSQIYPEKQTLMFSATFPGKLREICDEWIPHAISIRCHTVDMVDESSSIPPAPISATEEVGSLNSSSAAIVDSSEIAGLTGSDTANVSLSDHMQQTEPASVAINHATSSYTISDTVHQEVHICSSHKKPRLLIRYITRVREEEKVAKTRQPGLMLIFCTKIKTLKFVADFLRRQGHQNFTILHGQLPQTSRERALNDFKSGKIPVLIATDVAARGIHVKQLKYVVNYDFPSNLEQYCHRVGRTGRQGERGSAYSLLTRNLAGLTKDLISLLKSCNQEIEPNLQALCDEYYSGSISEADCVIEDDNET